MKAELECETSIRLFTNMTSRVLFISIVLPSVLSVNTLLSSNTHLKYNTYVTLIYAISITFI